MADRVAIEFAAEGEAAKINYSIPMPGAHTGRRVMEIELEFDEPRPFSPGAMEVGQRLDTAIGAIKVGDRVEFDESSAKRFFADQLVRIGAGFASQAVAPLVGGVKDVATEQGSARSAASAASASVVSHAVGAGAAAAREVSSIEVATGIGALLHDIEAGVVQFPVRNWAGVLSLVPRPLYQAPKPRFFLVERYGISSFLGDYGMGRTVKTFTLLPGESTTISLKTWQSTKESIAQSSSIIDSHEQSARERFADKVQHETTDKATASKTEAWHVEAEAKASWGFGSAKVSGGGSGEYHSGREQFARQASEAVTEHAAEASSKRELTVSSASEKSWESGSELLIERTITNVNKRRVLNFVFRELNQSYVTKLHLKDIRVGFTNGLLNSWREVPLSGLRTLLRETLSEDRIDAAAQQILRVAGTVFDADDTAVSVLERVIIDPKGDRVTVEPAKRNAKGDYPPPTDDMYYRFKVGPLQQDGAKNPVDGVLLNASEITMRTDSVVVEALVGQADALDAYAMEIQQAAATKDTLANERERLILDTLAAIEDPVQRADLAAKLLGTCCPDHGA